MPFALIVAALVAAAPAAAPPPAPPRVFRQAGYSEPPIGRDACRPVSASETRCQVPAMTAGMYLVRATDASTAAAAGAAQQLVIVAADQVCSSTHAPDASAPWAVGARRTFQSACLVTILTDTPLTIRVLYLDEKATKDPGGPAVTLTPEPWSGALAALPVRVPQ